MLYSSAIYSHAGVSGTGAMSTAASALQSGTAPSFSSALDRYRAAQGAAGNDSASGVMLSRDQLLFGLDGNLAYGSDENSLAATAPEQVSRGGLYVQSLMDSKEKGNSLAGKPLGSAFSSYQGQYFSDDITISGQEEVSADVEQFHFPKFVQKDGLTYAYFIDHTQGSENDVGLAISEDGVNFEYQGKVLEKGDSFDDAQASFPAVQYDGDTDTWYMLYEGKSSGGDVNSVCLATSADGITWEKQGPVISPNQAGEASDVDVGTPSMFKEDGVWHVYFHTFATDGRVRIGYASGEDLGNLSVSRETLLDTDAGGLEGGTVGARSNVVKVGDYYYMAYEVCSPWSQFAESYWGTNIARAESPDGPWEKFGDGPVLVNSEPGFGLDGPEFLIEDGQLYLYYRYGGNATGRVAIEGLGDGSQPLMAGSATGSQSQTLAA